VAEAERNSPIRRVPATAPPLVVAVGLGKLPELVRQSAEYAAGVDGVRPSPAVIFPSRAHDHFSILEELARPNGVILEALQEMARP